MGTPTVWEKMDGDIKELIEKKAKALDEVTKALGAVLADFDTRANLLMEDAKALRVQLMLTHDQLAQRENNVNQGNRDLADRETKVAHREHGNAGLRDDLAKARAAKVRAEESEQIAWKRVEGFKAKCNEAVKERETLERALALLLSEKDVAKSGPGGDAKMPAPAIPGSVPAPVGVVLVAAESVK